MDSHLSRREFLEASLRASPGLVGSLFATQKAGSLSRLPFKLGIITDEITDDFEKALDFISSCSLHGCELRDLWHKNIMNLAQADLDRARALIQQHHLQVSDIASPIFKYNLPEMPAHEAKSETFQANFADQDSEHLLKKSFELARFFGTTKVRIFSYWRADDPNKAYPYVRDRLAKAAEVAGKHGILLVLENEHTCNVGTGKELGRILREINSPHLRGNWDPGNAAILGEVPYPDGYMAVRGLFAHMHVKDVKKDPQSGKLQWAPVGGGFIDWRGQIKALVDHGYDGTMSLETHFRRPDGDKQEGTRESLDGLLKVIRDVGRPPVVPPAAMIMPKFL
jgi:L-ribulose-5-phosphate 3-epimerase